MLVHNVDYGDVSTVVHKSLEVIGSFAGTTTLGVSANLANVIYHGVEVGFGVGIGSREGANEAALNAVTGGIGKLSGIAKTAVNAGKTIAKTASEKGKEAQEKGKKGESDAREKYPEMGPKADKQKINGRKRIPDSENKTEIGETKDVKQQGWTKQLKDSYDLAKEKTKDLILYLREGNKTSRELDNAEIEGKVKIRRY